MQQKSLALGYTVACMSSSLGYTLGTLPLYHTIYPGARDLPYRKKICCFIPKSENRDILCTQEDLGWEEGFCVGGGREGRTEVELDREGCWEGDHVTKYLPVHHPLDEPQAELLRF